MGVSVRSVIESTGAADASVGQIASGVTLVDEAPLSGDTVLDIIPTLPDQRLAVQAKTRIELTPNKPKIILLNGGLGPKLVVENIPYSKTFGIQIKINVGSIHGVAGIAHFVEHILFKGTDKRSRDEILRQIKLLGGDECVNANTEEELTSLYAEVLNEDYFTTLDLFLDMLCNIKLDETEFDHEREVILKEIRETLDDPKELAEILLRRLMYKGNPLARPLRGTRATLKELTLDSVLSFMRDSYTVDNIIISIAGDIDQDALDRTVELIEKYTTPLIGREKPELKSNEKLPITNPGIITKRNNRAKLARLVLATKGTSMYDLDVHTSDLIDMALFSGLYSRGSLCIRENSGKAYGVKSITESFRTCGIFGVHTGVLVRDLAFALEQILRHFKQIKDYGLEEEELEDTKQQLIKKIKLENTFPHEIAEASAVDMVYYDRSIPIEETENKIRAVTNSDIKRVAAAQIFDDPRNFTIAVVGRVEEEVIRKQLQAVIDRFSEHWNETTV